MFRKIERKDPTENREMKRCLAYGVAEPYGDYFRKLTKCLVEDYCTYKVNFGKVNFCVQEEREKRLKGGV